ncbi:hypothetical protein AGMMS49546_20750 [Spirochaetia bacterium]|nr:hypothetical protein AGMMS49546_20750 [Spirochaetia bacterium]
MKKNKKGNGAFGTKAMFLLAMLVFGLVLAGCPTDSGGGNGIPGDDGVAKSITITPVTGITTVSLLNSTDLSGGGIIAVGTGPASTGTLTVALKTGTTGNGPDWTGTGSYWLAISPGGGSNFVYTGGAEIPANLNDLPKISITGANTTVNGDHFKPLPSN